MKYDSAEAAKMLRRLNDELSYILEKEKKTSSFLAAQGEDPESLRPDYDYDDTQAKIDSLCAEIRRTKHAINVFNNTHTVPGFNMAIDEALIYMPQLTAKKNKLEVMRSRLKRQREHTDDLWDRSSQGILDYRYANYEIEKVNRDYNGVCEELSRLQLALDKVNRIRDIEL